VLLGSSDVGEAQNLDRKSWTGCGKWVFWFSLQIAKKSRWKIYKYEFFL